MPSQDLKNILPAEVTHVIVDALQVHARDRTCAWESACEVAALKGEPMPDSTTFGINGINDILQRFGGAH